MSRGELDALLREQDRLLTELLAVGEREEAAETEAAQEDAKHRLIPFVILQNPRYRPGWFHRHLARQLEWFEAEAIAQRSPCVIVCVPPQHGKSELCSRTFPTWYIGRNPGQHVMLASYTIDLALQMSVAARAHAERAAPWWPNLRRGKSWTDTYWETVTEGSYRAAGRGGSITGMPAHIGIMDDMLKDEQEARSAAVKREFESWYETAFMSRLQEGAGQLLVTTRWAEDDPVGYLLKKQPGRWKVIRYPAIAETDEYDGDTLLRREGEPLSTERFSLQTMQDRKTAMTAHRWASVYQQRPTPEEGGVFSPKHFLNRYDALPEMDAWTISADLSFKGNATSDYVVFQIWGRKGALAYLVDMVREKLDYPAAKQKLRDLKAKYPKVTTVLIEDKANGPALIAEMRKEIPGILGWDPGKTDKRGRAELYSLPRYAAEQVLFPRSAPWMLDFEGEHLGFMAGAANDDTVDTESQYFAWEASRPIATPPPDLSRYNSRLRTESRWRDE